MSYNCLNQPLKNLGHFLSNFKPLVYSPGSNFVWNWLLKIDIESVWMVMYIIIYIFIYIYTYMLKIISSSISNHLFCISFLNHYRFIPRFSDHTHIFLIQIAAIIMIIKSPDVLKALESFQCLRWWQRLQHNEFSISIDPNHHILKHFIRL